MSLKISSSRLKLVLSCTVLLICTLLSANAYFGHKVGFLQNSLFSSLRQEIKLGLDLKGGVQMLLLVDFDKLIQDKISLLQADIKKSMRKNGLQYDNFRKSGLGVSLELNNKLDQENFIRIVKNIDSRLDIYTEKEAIVACYSASSLDKMRAEVLNQSIEVIRRRIDSFGTKEPTIQKQGDNCILVQVPGVKDFDSLRSLIGKTAQLSFHLIKNSSEQSNTLGPWRSIHVGNQMLDITSTPLITGELLTNALVQFIDGAPVVAFEMNNLGARIFGEVTRSYRGFRLAIILDEEVISVPLINEHIPAGKGIISGSLDLDGAYELALLLKSGALPARLKIVEEKIIGPSLGEDSLKASKISGVIALVSVALFMMWCYQGLGVIASFSLLSVLLYIFGALILFQITLTLPGIAGVILTLGMAVDANILVYEHIKEELSLGANALSAIKRGFKISYKTILDANLTSLIAAVLLYVFGVGVIRGFAVTFGLGIFASMFTCFWISQPLVHFYYRGLKKF